MQHRVRHWRVCAAVALIALVGAACGDSGSSGGGTKTASGKSGGTFRLGVSEPTSIDPYNAQETEGQLVTKNLFVGLVTLDDATLNLQPGVAEKWSKNADCTEWTFNLRKGTKFSNGEEVTAESFVRGITRAAKQKAASDVASFFADIDGFEGINGTVDSAGKPVAPKTPDKFTGLSAPDAQTLKVKLANADCDFDKKTLQPVFSPVPSVAGEADNKAFNDLPIGNGPFKMAEPWQHDKSITLVRNDSYFGQKPFLDRVELSIETVADEYKGFQAGSRDYARIPPELIPAAKAQLEKDGKFITEVKTGLNYLLVNNVNKPLNNPDARKAISAAIDRQAVIDGVFKGLQTKAESIVPPAFSTYFKTGQCEACTFNVTKAKEWAQKGGLTAGTKISFAYNADGGHKPWVEAIAKQLQDNLGVSVDIKEVPKFRDVLAQQKEPTASGLFRSGWGADFPSPLNFLYPLLGTGSGDNRGKYSNPTYDDLLKKAGAATDEKTKVATVQQAEKLALDEMGLIPLWYRTQYRAFDGSKWKNVRMDFFENPTLAVISQK